VDDRGGVVAAKSNLSGSTLDLPLNGCEWKKLRRKTLAQDVFDRRWSLDEV